MFDGVENLPVYKKASEIIVLAEHICESLKEHDQKEFIERQILLNASTLENQITAINICNTFSLKVEHLLRIKFAVSELFEGVLFASMIRINPKEYLQLMREVIEEFRIEFVKWSRTFDPSIDSKDDWGIRLVIDSSDDYEQKMIRDKSDFNLEDWENPWSGWDSGEFEPDDDEDYCIGDDDDDDPS